MMAVKAKVLAAIDVFRGGTHTMSYIKFDSSKLDKFVHANELEQM